MTEIMMEKSIADFKNEKTALAQREKELRGRAELAESSPISFLRDESWCWLALAACLASMVAGKRRSARPDQINDMMRS